MGVDYTIIYIHLIFVYYRLDLQLLVQVGTIRGPIKSAGIHKSADMMAKQKKMKKK